MVRVVSIGAADESSITEGFSREFCGGTHTGRTGEIGGFAVSREESVSAGVRRISALTGPGLIDYLLKRSRVGDQLCLALKAPADQIETRVHKLMEDNRQLGKALKSAAKQGGTDIMAQAKRLLDDATRVGEASIIVAQIEPAPIDQIRAAMDMLKKKARSAAVVLGFSEGAGKVMLLAAVTDDLIKRGVKAGDIVKQIAPIVGGGGGGRPQMAQAGGKDPSKLAEALTQAEALVCEALS